MEARPPTSRPAGGVVRGGHLDDGEERLARAARPAARPGPAPLVFESSVHAKRMEARPPTSRPPAAWSAAGTSTTAKSDSLARRGRRRARGTAPLVFESSVHAKRMEARPPTSRPAGGVVVRGEEHLDDGEERLALGVAAGRPPAARRDRRSLRTRRLNHARHRPRALASLDRHLRRAAAGVVKLNTKADPVEAVVEVFKHLHPAASSAALAVAKNGVASVLKGLEASDTSTENVAFEDENERRRARRAVERRGACSDITSREVCKNAANKADCSWSKSREKCKSKRKKCAEVKNKKTCHKKKYANICAWSFKKEKCRNAKCEEIDDERDCMSEGARKRGCKWKNNQERCIVDKDAGGGGGSDAFTDAELETKDVELETSAERARGGAIEKQETCEATVQSLEEANASGEGCPTPAPTPEPTPAPTPAPSVSPTPARRRRADAAPTVLRPAPAPPAAPTPPAVWIQRGDDIDGEAADDYSGRSVSLSADGATLAVGASGNDGAGSYAGHARVFAWDPVDETWKQRGDDIDGEAADDRSGYSVSLSADGTTLAVGARYNDGAGSGGPRARVRVGPRRRDVGSARRRHRRRGRVRRVGLLGVAERGRHGAGRRGAQERRRRLQRGRARVFAWDSVDETWKQRGDDIDGEAAGDESGYSVSLSADGTTLAVGAPYNGGAGFNAGHARVRVGLRRRDVEAARRRHRRRGRGRRVGLLGVAERGRRGAGRRGRTNDGAGSNAGHARVFAWDSDENEWKQRGEDIDGEAADDYSGYSVSLSADGTALAVGASGNAAPAPTLATRARVRKQATLK
ncbi:hypothetical protein SO694_00086027 [Aureococcus anophagefferens]|uniref:Uncharacterized protein n=1 Tax=Aureococcus anophagefferens TaxID=44056 RepID=A0ABR1G4C5_AURAN